jgi:pyruvate dehydrogenase complex dehydrogenase (E1) component
MAYDPAFAYELAVIVRDGMRACTSEQEDVFYYLTLQASCAATRSRPSAGTCSTRTRSRGAVRDAVLEGRRGAGRRRHRLHEAVPDQVARWVPRPYTPLGTDGFGRSDTREALRRFFEIDLEIFEVVLDRLADQVSSTAAQKLGGAVQLFDQLWRHACGDPGHGEVLTVAI